MPKIDLGKVVGEDAKITIGTTTTLDAGNDATVENVGTKSDAVLNFGIPKGYTPIKGTDYWTENDIDEIHDYVDEQISAIDLTPYSEKTETGHSIELSINAQTYVMTATLKNVSGDVLNTQTIDLPLETMVVSGSYDSATKEVVLTLQSGSTIRFSVSDLVDGLVSESDLEVTLADYVSRETFDSIVGDLDDLSTEDKTTLVNAINEVVTDMGDLSIKELERGVYNIDELDDGIYVQEATRTIKLNLPRRSDGHDQGEEYVQYELLGILIKASSVSDEPSIMGHYIFTTMDENNSYVMTIVQGYYEKFEDPAGVEEPIIIGEYETAYNAAKKYTNNVTGNLANLDTTDKTNLVNAINEVASGSGINTTIIPIGAANSFILDLTTYQDELIDILNSVLPDDIGSMEYNVYNLFYPTDNIIFGSNKVHFIRLIKSHNMLVGVDDYYTVHIFLDDFLSSGGTSGSYTQYRQHYHNSNYQLFCSFDESGKITGVYRHYDLTTKGNVAIYTGETWYVPTNGLQMLSTNNTNAYNPTPNSYNPATTKYVDDAINNSSENNIHYLGEIGQYTIDNPLNLNLLNKGVYILTNTSMVTQYYISKEYNGNVTKTPITFSTNYWNGHTPIFLKMFTEISDELASDTTVCEFSVQETYNNYGGDARIIEIYAPVKLNAAVYWYGAAEIVPVTISNDQTVTGKKTFATLPETSVAPTSNNQMVNKKYVDDAIAAAITTTLGGSY